VLLVCYFQKIIVHVVNSSVWNHSPMFSSNSFIILNLTFISSTHVEVSFVSIVSFFCMWTLFCYKLSIDRLVYFSALSHWSTSLFLFMSIPCCLFSYIFVWYFVIRSCKASFLFSTVYKRGLFER
jgi:hypothetical protein